MHSAMNEVGLGVWEWSPRTNLVRADPLAQKAFGMSCPEEGAMLIEFLSALPAPDRRMMRTMLEKAILTNCPQDSVHKIGLTNHEAKARTRTLPVDLSATHGKSVVLCVTQLISVM